MTKLKKLSLVASLISTVIVTIVGVYAWFYMGSDKEVNKFITELDSTRIFEASMRADLNGQEIKYSDANHYDANMHMFTFNNVHELETGFKVFVTIEAKKKIKIRFKIAEVWSDSSNKIIPNPGYITYNIHGNLSTYPNDTYIYYNPSIQKEDVIEDIQVIESISLPEGLTTTHKLKFAVIVEAVQYNYEDTWESYPAHINNEKVVVAQTTTVTVDFHNVFQVGILRGILIEFVDGNKKYQFVYSEANPQISVTITSGNYDVYVYTHKLFQYQIKIEGTKLVVNITYKPVSNYVGVHGFLFSPNIIREFKTHTAYPKGTIVYTIVKDPNKPTEEGTKKYWIATQNIPSNNTQVPSTSWAGFEIMGRRWNDGNTVTTGKIVYYNGTFWQFTANGSNWNAPGSENGGWKRLDNLWFLNNTYKIGDITLSNGTYWLTVTNGNNYAVPGSNASYDKFTSLGYGFIETARSSYKLNDIVLVDGIYYQASNNSWKNPNIESTDGNDGWVTLGSTWDYEKQYQIGQVAKYQGKMYERITNDGSGPKPTNTQHWKITTKLDPDIWSISKSYNQNNFVIYQGESYLLKNGYNNISGVNATPGSSIYWRKLTENFDSYNSYKQLDKYSLVYYQDAWWKWNYSQPSDSVRIDGKNPLPGQIYGSTSYWQEITITWKPYNRYKQDDMVIFGGHFYRAKVDVNNFRHVGDVQHWERFDIDWNPNV